MSLPTRSDYPHQAELESAIAALTARQQAGSRELSQIDRDLSEATAVARAAVVSNLADPTARPRRAAQAKVDDISHRRDQVLADLEAVKEELEIAIDARPSARAVVDGALAAALRGEIEKQLTAGVAIAFSFVSWLEAARATAEHADRQLSDDAGRYLGDALGLPAGALSACAAFDSVDRDAVERWRRDVRAAFPLLKV